MPQAPCRVVLASFVNRKHLIPPLGLGYLKAFADRELRGEFQIDIIGPIFKDAKNPDKAVLREILDLSPDIVGFSVFFWNLPFFIQLSRDLKAARENLFLVAGGPEVSGTLFQRWSELDALIVGEGEIAFAEMLRRRWDGRVLDGIPGVWHRSGADVRCEPPGNPILDLDVLPSPYLSGALGLRPGADAALETSRGCPKRCGFCGLSLRPERCRYFSVDRVIRETRWFLEKEVKRILVTDADLFSDKKRALTLVEAWSRLPGVSRVEWLFNTDPRYWDPEIASSIGRLRSHLDLGIQTTNFRALKAASRLPSHKAAEKLLGFIRSPAVQLEICLILGLPEDDPGGFRDSLEWVLGQGAGVLLRVYRFLVLPQTPFGQDAERWGLIHNPEPPYEIRETRGFSSGEIEHLEELSRWICEFKRYPAVIDALYRAASHRGGARPNLAACENLIARLRGAVMPPPTNDCETFQFSASSHWGDIPYWSFKERRALLLAVRDQLLEVSNKSGSYVLDADERIRRALRGLYWENAFQDGIPFPSGASPEQCVGICPEELDKYLHVMCRTRFLVPGEYSSCKKISEGARLVPSAQLLRAIKRDSSNGSRPEKVLWVHLFDSLGEGRCDVLNATLDWIKPGGEILILEHSIPELKKIALEFSRRGCGADFLDIGPLGKSGDALESEPGCLVVKRPGTCFSPARSEPISVPAQATQGSLLGCGEETGPQRTEINHTPSEPRRIEIKLGSLCNNRCVFCISSGLRDDKVPWTPSDRVKEEITYFYEKGCRSLGFLGGEPTVYPDIIECIEYARDLGYVRIAICTNGTRLSDEQFCKRLALAGVTRFAVSIHSHRPEIEDDLITRVPGNWKRKIAGLRHLLTLEREGYFRDNVSLNPVLSRQTYREMEGYVRFFLDMGIQDIRFNYIWPHGEALDDPGWTPPYRVAVPEMVRLMLMNEQHFRIRLTFGGVPKCTLRFARISERLQNYLMEKYLDESVFDPPNDVSMPETLETPSERFVWQEKKRDVLKTLGPECESCRFFRGCDGVWKTYADLYGLEELQPIRHDQS